jgi:predicted membrane protein
LDGGFAVLADFGAEDRLILDNLNIIDYGLHDIIFSWEVIIIIIGAVMFLSSWDVTGLILIFIGTVFLLANHYNFDVWQLWPVVLILIGIKIIFKPRKYHHDYDYKIKDSHGRRWVERHDNLISHDVVFTEVKEMNFSNNFQGGKINGVFSGIHLDLTNAKLADGDNILDIKLIFSGITLIVPREWKVVIRSTQVLGGVSDKRKNSVFTPEDGKTLIIEGTTIFGGCEIKSY